MNSKRQQPLRCANCDIEIAWVPVMAEGKPYCCQGCTQGGPCVCSYTGPAGVHGMASETPLPEPVDAKASNVEANPADEIKASLADLVVSCLRNVQAWQHNKGGKEDADALRPALEEMSTVLKQAAARLEQGQAPEAISPERQPATYVPVTVVVSPLCRRALVQRYGRLLCEHPGISRCSVEQWDGNAATFEVWAASPSDVMRSLWKIEHFRPRDVKLSGDRLEVSLGETATTYALSIGDEGSHLCELGVDVFFNARHFLVNGHQGPTHPHSWRVQARFSGTVNKEGMLLGFAEAQQILQHQVERFNGVNLNDVAPFTEIQPTAENVAAVLYEDIRSALDLPSIRLTSVCLWESPTSYVLYTGDGHHEV